MGRTVIANDTLNRPPITLSEKASGHSYGTSSDTRSATASITAIALTGPGVISFLAFSHGASQQKQITKVYVDGVQALSTSAASALIIASNYVSSVVGGFEFASTTTMQPTSSEEIPFRSSFLCMYEMPTHSAVGTTIYYTYRLTE